MKTDHILLATDLSLGARHAYPHAAGMAKVLDARVTLFHVDETAYYGFHTSTEILQLGQGHATAHAIYGCHGDMIKG